VASTKHDEEDPVLTALAELSATAASSADELNRLDEVLTSMVRSRRSGLSWRRILVAGPPEHPASEPPAAMSRDPMSAIARIAADLGRANSGLRRALVRALQRDGMQISDIANVFSVSRQRVGALLRPRRPR
jgi:hypothetical protein